MLRILPLLILLLSVGGAVASDDAAGRRVAVRQLAEKAAQGDAKSLYDLAMLHDTGYDSIPVDSARSTALYILSARNGYAPAMSYLGYRYFNGEHVRQNVDSALFWIAKAAGAGDPRAANNLGYLLSHSDVVSHDYPQAVHWLRKAADAGLPQGESLLADMLRQGLGTAPDTVQAETLYVKAIEAGLQDAELKLLSMKGRDWEQLSPDSALNLGRYFYTHRAPIIGVTLFANAASAGNPDALALLGDAYSKGLGMEYDHARSIECFLRAAMLGNPSAQFVVGELLDIFPDALDEIPHDNFHVTPEMKTPSYWYGLARQAGITSAEAAAGALGL